MTNRSSRTRSLPLLLLALFIACSSDDAPVPEGDGNGDGKLTSCLDSPTILARPPEGRLPCDLIPPGLTL